MFSGKTEELFRRLRRAQFANQAILLVKPSIDERYASEEVVSHVGQSWAALRCQRAQEILDLWNTNVTNLPEQITRLEKLKEIDLRGISMNPTQQQQILDLLPNVKILLSAPCNCGF